CALDIIGARFVREVENGEVIVISEEGVESLRPFPRMHPRPCVFEYVYFSRPDSILGGRSVYEVRKQFGRQLAQEAPADVDVIIPVPDSGVPAALGYSQEAGIPFELGIIRNHYVGRTFIEPSQTIRALGVRLKHSANRAVVAGQRIVLIDDSLVRGTTSAKIVRMMRDAGAKAAHFRIASPPTTPPDGAGAAHRRLRLDRGEVERGGPARGPAARLTVTSGKTGNHGQLQKLCRGDDGFRLSASLRPE